MTEQEAKTKWCPFAREQAHTGYNSEGEHKVLAGSFNRGSGHTHDSGPGSACDCIASACMAWEWDKDFRFNSIDGPDISTAEGHCGLSK